MDTEMGMLAVIGVCAFVLCLVTGKNRVEWILNFALRAVLGGISIFGINSLLSMGGLGFFVGINPISLLTSGTLGFSGVSLLYAIAALNFL